MHINSYINAFSQLYLARWGRHGLRWTALMGLGAVLTACATGPKMSVQPAPSLGVYAIESVSVTSISNRAAFAEDLQQLLDARIISNGVGAKARLSVNLTDLRYKSLNTSIFARRSSFAAINVVLKSSASGLTLRNFRLSARSGVNNRAVARDELMQSLSRQLAQIFPITMPAAPSVAAPEAPKKIKIVKKNVAPTPKPKPESKPASTPRVVEFNQFPKRTTPAKIEVSVAPKPVIEAAKPKLLPVASATPGVEPVVEADVQPAVPVVEASPPVVAVTPPVSAGVSRDEDELCVVTLEDDCSGIE